MITIDAIGIDCPKPVIMAKKELDKMAEGAVEILADNAVCVQNLIKLAESNGFKYDHKQESEDRFIVHIYKNEESSSGDEVKTGQPVNDDFTIAIGSRYFGDGDDVLGEILMKSFIYTVTETEPLPKTIVFYNSGVYLTVKDSPVLDDIKVLAENGVEIISCGTCLDFFGLKEELAVGEISNMYTIYEAIKNAGRNMVIG